MLQIDLDQNEYQYLCKSPFIINAYEDIISSIQHHNDKYVLKISEDLADEIRNLCSEHLLLVGLDENYNPTFEGAILESLIDKLFV